MKVKNFKYLSFNLLTGHVTRRMLIDRNWHCQAVSLRPPQLKNWYSLVI